MAWIGLDDKLGAEVMKSRGLEKELHEVKGSLLKESYEHDTLRVAVELVCDDLKLAPEQEMSLFMVRTIQITDWAHDIARPCSALASIGRLQSLALTMRTWI